jgi:hypothetical protein
VATFVWRRNTGGALQGRAAVVLFRHLRLSATESSTGDRVEGRSQVGGCDRIDSADGSGWCVLRAFSDEAEYPILDLYPYLRPVPCMCRWRARRCGACGRGLFRAWVDRLIAGARSNPGGIRKRRSNRCALLQRLERNMKRNRAYPFRSGAARTIHVSATTGLTYKVAGLGRFRDLM